MHRPPVHGRGVASLNSAPYTLAAIHIKRRSTGSLLRNVDVHAHAESAMTLSCICEVASRRVRSKGGRCACVPSSLQADAAERSVVHDHRICGVRKGCLRVYRA
eukprot:5707730-Amphidinium_carterae.2